MTRVVIDTSVFIHYLIRPGAAIQHILEDLWLRDEIEIISSPELIAELEDVLARPKMKTLIHPDEGETLLMLLQAKAELMPVLGEIPVFTRDPKDDKFVACAVVGKVAFLISLDKDILVLGRVGEIKMVTPYEFINR
ncbi:MAG: putative toxin-antitoxin system toxin component, PIN family [Chloroflexota bacterium]|nr:putative toxin-antitoxin system toxin component, PIN family [Chloroflexota bacterium]